MAGTTSQVLDEAYVSSQTFVHKREIYNKLYDAKNERSIIDFFYETGRDIVSEQTEFHHHENDYIYNNIEILSAVGTGAGVPVLVTLAVVNHTNGKSFPKVTDIVIFQDRSQGYISEKDTSVPTAHTITIKPLTTLSDIGPSLIAGQLIAFISSAHAEGSPQPEGLVTPTIKFDGICQIFKNDYKSTGTERSNTIEFNFEGKDRYYYKSEHDLYLKHMMDVDFAMIMQERADGLVDVNGDAIRTTEGLIPSIEAHGNTFNGPINALSDIDDIVKILDKQRGSVENVWLAGINQDINIDNVLIAQTINGGISYNTFGDGDAKQRGIDLGFSSFRKGSFSFHKRKASEFNHPNVTGSAGHTWPDVGIIMPTDKGMDPETSKSIDSIRMRYKAAPGSDRRGQHWTTGAQSRVNKTDVDELRMHYLTEAGLEVFGLHRFMFIS